MTAQLGADIGATNVLDTDDIPWATLQDGVEMKMLRRGEKSMWRHTVVFRFAPGVEMPIHHHTGEVHAYTIDGRWGYREYDWLATAGHFVYEEPGSVHTLYTPEDNSEPTTVFFVMDASLVLLIELEDEEISMIQDARTLDALYRAALANEGLEYPHAVLP